MAEVKNQSLDAGDKSEANSAASWLPAITDQERSLATQATNEFNRSNYDACLNLMNKLAATRGSDLKMVLNQALAEYYKSGLTKTDEFKQTILGIYSKVSLDEAASSLDDADQCLLYYNHAIILFHTKQYTSAFAVLEKVLPFLDNMEESVARRIAMLTIELCLCTFQPYRALAMTETIEKIGSSSSNNKSMGASTEKDDSDRSSKEGSVEPVSADSSRSTVCQFRARCYLMLRSIKSKRELKALMSSVGLTPYVAFLKANCELLRGNYQKSLRVLNTSVLPLLNDETCNIRSTLSLFLNNNLGALHYSMRKYNMACLYFSKANDENTAIAKQNRKTTDTSPLSLSGQPLQTLSSNHQYELLYNMGISLLQCGQPQAAFDCLLNAVQVYHMNPRLWLRLAECCVMVNKKSNDEDCRLEKRLGVIQGSVGSTVHRKLILGQGVNSSSQTSSNNSGAMPMPTMEFAALCLDNALHCLDHTSSNLIDVLPANSETLSDDTAEPNKPTEARMILAAPAYPMKVNEVNNVRCSILALKAYVALHHNDHLVALQAADGLLRQPCLSGAQRYLGQMYKAEALVGLDRITDSIDQLNVDSVTDISTTFPDAGKSESDKLEKQPGEMESETPNENRPGSQSWVPRDLNQAKAIILYNLAVTYTMRGEYDKANAHLNKIFFNKARGLTSQVPVLPGTDKSTFLAKQPIVKPLINVQSPLYSQMYYLKIYIELMEGHRKSAHNFIREHFGHMTMNRL